MSDYEKFLELIKNAKKIVFFGGAGVSTASGIKDFRSKDGLYNCISKYNAPYEVMLSHSYYEENTETFYKFYREFMINTEAKPNVCHKFLADLESKKDIWVVTQNIDGLHQMAGSKNVIELHGTIHRNFCTNCFKEFNLDYILNTKTVIPHCDKCGDIIKPHVVLYEEQLLEHDMTKALIKIEDADLLIVAGTSLNVYPAAGMVNYFFGNNIVLIDKNDIHINKDIKLFIKDDIKNVFQFMKEHFNEI